MLSWTEATQSLAAQGLKPCSTRSERMIEHGALQRPMRAA